MSALLLEQGGTWMRTWNVVGPLARTALRQSPHPALHSLEVDEIDGAVVLTGRVGSYYDKQLAQEAVLSVVGGRSIVNNIRVAKHTVASEP